MSCNGFQDREADVGRLFPGVDSQNGGLKDKSKMTDAGRFPLGYLSDCGGLETSLDGSW